MPFLPFYRLRVKPFNIICDSLVSNISRTPKPHSFTRLPLQTFPPSSLNFSLNARCFSTSSPCFANPSDPGEPNHSVDPCSYEVIFIYSEFNSYNFISELILLPEKYAYDISITVKHNYYESYRPVDVLSFYYISDFQLDSLYRLVFSKIEDYEERSFKSDPITYVKLKFTIPLITVHKN